MSKRKHNIFIDDEADVSGCDSNEDSTKHEEANTSDEAFIADSSDIESAATSDIENDENRRPKKPRSKTMFKKKNVVYTDSDFSDDEKVVETYDPKTDIFLKDPPTYGSETYLKEIDLLIESYYKSSS